MIVKNITFIGAGNMAGAIIAGLLSRGYPAESVRATTRSADSAARAADKLGIETGTDNLAAVRWADVVVLAVKPQMLGQTCAELRDAIDGQLVMSVAAGIDTATLADWLGEDVALVRSMPNTPSQVGVGASGLYANARASAEDHDFATQIADATGISTWVEDESLMHAVTAISGSGPAYYFLFMEAMIETGVELGLARDSARTLALQTARGAAELASQADVEVDELKRRVMSPGGTTERAIHAFEEGGLRDLVKKAATASAERSRTLAAELGGKNQA